MDIAEKFKQCTTITEVFTMMRYLRGEGYNDTEVNQAANKRKKELITCNSARPTKLKKLIPPADPNNGVQFASFNVKIKHLHDNTINIVEDGFEI